MKNVLLFLLGLILTIAIWYGESRKFFCLENGQCVTVWKTYNNVCYIVPGKYYGIIKPSENFIESTNTNIVTLFFTSELPRALIFNSEQALKINNNNKSLFVFYDYKVDAKRFTEILYKPNAKKASDIKENAGLIDLYILENYATDKHGKKL